MNHKEKSREQLIKELAELHKKIALVEASEKELERKNTELSEREERYRLLFENTPSGFQSMNEHGQIIEANTAWLNLLGYSKSEVIGRRFADFITKEYQESFEDIFLGFKKAGEIHDQEFEMIRKDGAHVRFSFNGKIHLDASGKFKQTHCFLHDVTELKRTRKVMDFQKAEQMFRERILSKILNTFDLDERLETILDEVTAFVNVEFSGIFLEKQEIVILHTYRGLSPRLRSHLLYFPVSKVPDWLRKSGILRTKLDQEDGIPDFLKKEGIQSMISITLSIPASGDNPADEWLGNILLADRSYDAFTKMEIEALQRISSQVALAIDHSRIYRQATQRLIRLETLHEIDRAIIQQLNLKDILHVVLDRVPKELGADAVAISLMDGEPGRPEVFIMRLPNGTMIEKEAFILTESLLHWFVERKETVIIYDLAEDPRLQMHHEEIRSQRLSSYLGVPLVAKEKTIGILHILTREPMMFQEENVNFFRTLAGQVAIAIENVRLYGEERHHAKELEKKVTDLKDMAITLEKSRERLIEAHRIARMGNWNWDILENRMQISEDIFDHFDEKFENFDGTYEGALNYVHPEDRKLVEMSFNEALYDNGILDVQHRIVLADGREMTVHQRARVLLDDTGKPIKMNGTVQDITKSKELERLAIQQEKMISLGRVASGIAHEIRNPLSGINIILDAVKENLKEVEEVEELIDEAKAATGKISAVIKKVLDFARPVTPRMNLIDINETIRVALSSSEADLQQSGIVLESDLESDLPEIYADRQLLEQVVLNLISNATEAMEEIPVEKKIFIASCKERTHVVIKVCDSGHGIYPDERERVFEPFYTKKRGGSGIGLSICRRIIQDHAGTISINDSDLGGAEFTIRIPIERRTFNR